MGSLHERSFLQEREVPVMKSSRTVQSVLLLFGSALLLFAGCAKTEVDEEAPPEPVRHAQKLRPPLEYRAVEGTQGALREAVLYSQKVPALATDLEVRSMLVLARESVLPTDRETLVEVRAGEVWTVSGAERKAHPTGDIWLVGKGSHVTLKAKGEMAVVRAISLASKPGR
jgi:hypothetical protein